MDKRKLMFLDLDGVVNTIYFDENGKSTLGRLSNNKVNNWQAICWLNELYKQVPYVIVISSIWRLYSTLPQLEDILYGSGLSKDIKIIGITPELEYKKNKTRGMEIDAWLKKMNWLLKVGKISKDDFIILDDDSDMWKHKKHLIKCTQAGFTINEFQECLKRWENA